MSISLKNIDDRVRALESKINTGKFTDTGWINGSIIGGLIGSGTMATNSPLLRYRVLNGVVYLEISGVLRTNRIDNKIATMPGWKYGTCYFGTGGYGDRGGAGEGKSVRIESNGTLYNNTPNGGQYQCIGRGVYCCPINL